MSGDKGEGVVEELLGDPSAVSAISQKIAQFINSTQQPPLPPDVQRRVHALKNLQVDFLKVESEFYREVQLLEVKYMKQYQPLLDKRREIVRGEYEPTDEECQWVDETDEKREEAQKEGSSSPATGIPDFWLTALKNTDILSDWVKEHDEPALSHLTDIRVVYPSESGLEFVLEFQFSENEWFSNSVLTKSYKMNCEVEEDEPFSFEGAAITSCEGCSIDWKKGKNLTIKTVKKKQKHKGGGQGRVVSKTVPNESFFSFFSPPKLEEEEEEEVSQLLSDDYARAEFIRDRLVPKAVLFFTGEMAEDEDEFDMEEGEEEEDEEEEGEEGAASGQMNKPECKQQ